MFLAAGTVALRVGWRLPLEPRQRVAQCLVVGAVLVTAANATSRTFARYLPTDWDGPGSPVRFAVPAIIFIALAAAIAGPSILGRLSASARRVVVVGLLGLGLLDGTGALRFVVDEAREPPGLVHAPIRPFVEWLQARGLTRGVGDYWMTQLVSAFTQGKMVAVPVRVGVNGRLVPYRWLTDTSRFSKALPTQFVLYFRGSDSGVTPRAIAATFGTPSEVVELVPGQFVACFSACPSRAR